MSSAIHNKLIEEIRRAWEELNADIIEPYLSEDLHYYSWWAMVDFHSKDSYLAYIIDRFQSYKNIGVHPIVKLGINKNDGEYAVALQLGDDVPTLIRIKEEDGIIKEMWMQPAE
jgi:hypothetical protein